MYSLMRCAAIVGVLGILVVGLGAAAQSASGDKDALTQVQRFASLRADEVNVRAGPGVRYPVKWVFVRKLMPVEIIAEFDTWRKIRDWEGAEGWVHRAMLSGRRSIVVTGKVATLRRQASKESPAVARLGPGMIATVETCDKVWCQVVARGFEGWIERHGIWGLTPSETFR